MSKTIFDIRARTTSWEFIIQNHINRLPVNPLSLCTSLGIKTMSYNRYSAVIGKPISYITQKYSTTGFCLFFKNQYYVVCNEAFLDQTNLNCIVAHELAHIVLGHIGPELPQLTRIHCINQHSEECLADKFAGRLLCPSIVLHLCGVSSPSEIQTICAVSPELAGTRWEHLQELRRLKRFLQIPQEQAVMDQFAKFITDYIADKFQ